MYSLVGTDKKTDIRYPSKARKRSKIILHLEIIRLLEIKLFIFYSLELKVKVLGQNDQPPKS